MIILNAGLPRSGTILVNAIIRAALATADTPVKGLNVGQMALPATLADCVADPSHHHVVHMHTWDAESQKIFTANRAQFVPFANIRDPRDCVVSQMRLHDFDLEKATGAIGRFSNQVSKFQKETSPVMLRYEALITHRATFIDLIALRLGLSLSPAQISEIDDATSKDVMAKLSQQVANGVAPSRNVQTSKRMMLEHRDLHITDRHIQSGKQGRWLEELSTKDANFIQTTLLPVIRRFGYDPVAI